MAYFSPASVSLEGNITCSLCQMVLREPVTITCGHNFCRQCLDKEWAASRKEGYSCPDCHRVYKNRPAFEVNHKLKNVLELTEANSKKTGNIVTYCDFCLEDPLPCVKICKTCDVSLCQLHLRKHQDKFLWKVHVLVEPTLTVQNKKCSEHNKAIEYYCSNDQSFICASCCVVGSHKTHQVQTLTEAHQDTKAFLQQEIKGMQQSRKALCKVLAQMQRAEADLKQSTKELRIRVQNVFEEIQTLINQQEKEVLDLVSAEEASQLTLLTQAIQNMEQKQKSTDTLIQEAQSLYDQNDDIHTVQAFMPLQEKIHSHDTTLEQVVIEEKQLDEDTIQKIKQQTQSFINDVSASLTWKLKQSTGLILCLLNNSDTIPGYEITDSPSYSPGALQVTPNCVPQDKSALLQGYKRVTLKPYHLGTEPDSLYSLNQRAGGYWTLKSGFIFSVMEKEVFPHFKCNPRLSSGDNYWEVELFSTGHGRFSLGVTHHHNESYRIHWDDSELWACAWKTPHKRLKGIKIVFPVKIIILFSYRQGLLSFYQQVLGDKQQQTAFFPSAQECNSLVHLHTFDCAFSRHIVPGFSLWACDIKFL
ncbi:E3 ubiquitin/ISG15 ligase TRIM25-like [Protopterus annectens]|uniref:E3 ubiquitin/ISG15 ligase TRIM25-like n=1 Tax=Protopterus annectens TaxID=7888 RepID=UPI001CFAFEA2|nr:E3 ubiquitin/ISG15 ligase TRIM25-like [Protopterus annectens]